MPSPWEGRWALGGVSGSESLEKPEESGDKGAVVEASEPRRGEREEGEETDNEQEEETPSRYCRETNPSCPTHIRICKKLVCRRKMKETVAQEILETNVTCLPEEN